METHFASLGLCGDKSLVRSPNKGPVLRSFNVVLTLAKQAVEQSVELHVICDAMKYMQHHYNGQGHCVL